MINDFKNFPSKERWVMIRLLSYLIILGTITIIVPEAIEWTGTVQLIFATTELIYVLRKPRQKPVDMPLELEDYDK